MKWISFFMAMSALFLNTAFGVYKPNVIYGEDNRADVYQIQDKNVQYLSKSTVALVEREDMISTPTGYDLKTREYGSRFQLCAEERFFAQPSVAMCSGFLVGEDLIATAGHCVDESSCKKMAFVFNFAMRSESQAPQSVDHDDVYFCSQVVSREYTNRQDYALVKLDRAVKGHEPLKLSTAPAKESDKLVVIGHPSGIPTKVTGGAQVRESLKSYFTSNLDTYGGNSGSAVFNAETMEVLGILVRGEKDYFIDYQNKCYRSYECPEHACRGEDVTHISYINKSLESAKISSDLKDTGVTYLD